MIKNAIAYADDLLIFIEGDNRFQIEEKCSQAMGVVDSWCKSAKLNIAIAKTTYMLLRVSMGRNPVIRLGENSLSRSEVTKYLGVSLDESLTLRAHAELVCERGEAVIIKVARLGQGEFRLPWTPSGFTTTPSFCR